MAYKSVYRSRLDRLEERRNVKKATLMVVLTMFVVGAFFWLGLPVLAGLAGFLGGIGRSGAADRDDIIPPSPPQILLPFAATNSAVIAVKGHAEPGSTIYLTVNSSDSGNTLARDDGGFLFGTVKLAEGDNLLEAAAVDKAGNRSQISTSVRLYFSQKPPQLAVESPTEGAVVTGKPPKVEVKGVTNPGNRVLINDRLVIVGGDGRFSLVYGLSEGQNVLVIVATDQAGNQSRKEITVEAKAT